jgi:hypothetical protein
VSELSRTLVATLAGALGITLPTLALGLPSAQAVEPCFDGGTHDINGDGHTDAVVGDPYATVDGQVGAGRVIVLYGDADHRVGEGARAVLTVAELGRTPEAGDHFGWSVATGEVDMDSCTDVVIGAPGEDLPEPDAGAVHVVYGSKDGLDGDTTSEHLTQFDAAGAIEPGDHFGQTVAVGENLGQDTSVVVIGAPDENVGAVADAGAVHVVNFSDSIPVGTRQVTQDTAGVPDTAEPGDRFGASLALGVDLLRNDGGWELLAGAAGESVGSRASAGSVTLVTEIQGAPPTGTWEAARYTQDSPGVPGTAEKNDRFGASLAVGNRNIHTPGSVRRIAVGAPGEGVGPDSGAGAVNLFEADSTGLQGLSSLTQDTTGVGDSSEAGDHFGAAVAVMASSTPRLAVGTPDENLGSASNAGLVQRFHFDDVDTDSAVNQNSPGAAGAVHDNSRYGIRVAALEGGSESVFLVGNPLHATGAVHVNNVSGGFASRAWLPGSGGVPAGAARFGWSAGGHDDLG